MIWSEPTLVEIDMLESALGETADRHPGNRADARLRETAHPSRMQQSLVVLRRDLRLEDHQALAQACRRSQSVYMLFVFDRDILDLLPEKLDRRVDFIWQSLRSLEQRLAELGERQSLSDSGPSSPPLLITAHAKASLAVPAIAIALGVEAVFFNHDDEPYALERDRHIAAALQALGIDCYDFKDHVVFERKEVLSQSAKAYSVFTPYKKTWLARLAADESVIESADADLTRLVSPGALQREKLARVAQTHGFGLWLGTPPTLDAIGFQSSDLNQLKVVIGTVGAQQLLDDFSQRIDRYDQARDFPSLKGPSYLSVHLRFGTISIRKAARLAYRQANAGAQTWLSELIWRDFYMQILYHFPQVAQRAFKPEYDLIRWEEGPQADADFVAWCSGQTGYPLVDAAMRQLLQSGYMHNRLRMVTASFLCKDLGIDWRRGEAWFAQHLLDFDLAANNGGWQWAASSGCDAQPYFRIFNPVSQSLKFDREGRFIRRYVPELGKLPDPQIHAPWDIGGLSAEALGLQLGRDYPMRIVDHDQARKKTLARYQVVKKLPT